MDLAGVTVELREVAEPAGQAPGFGDLAEAAMALPAPAHEEIAKTEDRRYIGTHEVQNHRSARPHDVHGR